MGLTGIGEGLDVHVLVEQRQEVEISILLRGLVLQVLGDVVEHPLHVVQGLGAAEQRQVPAGVVGHRHRVVEDVGLLQHR